MTKRKLLNQNVLFFLISLLGLFIFSCKNPLAQSQENQLSKETVKLKISTNFARTVLPTQFNAQTPGLTWTLTGIKDGASTSTDLGTWSDDDDTGAVSEVAYSKMTSAEISVDVGTWNFTLDVTNSSNEKVLTGTTGSINVSTDSTLTFVMQEPTEGDVAPGQIDFTLNFPSGGVDKVETTLTKYGDAATPVGSGQVDLSIGEVDDSVTYTNTVSAGTYMLKLDLQQQDPAVDTYGDYETINTYTCLIRVAPGLCSTGTETLTSLAKLYKITYELNEGTIDPNVTITSYNKYTKFELPTPIRNGYTFLGWCTDESCTSESCEHLQEAGTTISISEDTTFYAKWQEQTTSADPSDQTNGLSYFSKKDDSGANIECLNIHTAQGLALYRDIVNGTLTNEIIFYKSNYPVKTIKPTNTGRIDAYLKKDITVEDWIPIGIYNADDTASNKLYSSNFYGNGYTITISSVNSSATNVGLFGYAGNYNSPNTISNLIVKGDFSTVTPKYAGGIVSYAMGVNIENCVNYATIKATFSAGGIVGYIGTSNNSSNYIKKCINLGEIQQNTDVYYGGIAGFASSTINISDCINLKDLPVWSSGSSSGIVFVNTNVTSSIDRCINVGKSACPSAYAIANSGVKSNCYYNSETTYDGWQDLIDKTDENVIQKTTADLCALNSGDLSDQWSFAEEGEDDRYPLPNLSGVYNATVWSDIKSEAEVELSGSEVPEEITGTEVRSLTELSNAIADTAIEVIVIADDIEVTETLDITRDVTILANENFTLTHSMTSDNLFWIAPDAECVFTLGGGAGELIITGDAIYAAITTNSSKITKNIKENVTFTGLDHYAISVVNRNTTLNINGGKFDYNNYSPIYVSQPAIINFYSGSISNNSISSIGNSGSIYLQEGTLTIGEEAICKDNTKGTNTGSLIWIGSSATATLNGEVLPTNTLYENNIGE